MNAISLSPITTRFAWKEFRTLRGFWIAAFLLGGLIQWLAYATHDRPPGTDWPSALFVVALVTAALYAIGVAATTFSMEHEEETYSFLTSLPTRWLPIFAGKMLFALVSAGALLLVLAIVGVLMTGGELPGVNDAAFALGGFGFLIVEALVWGTCFSLLLRQPLFAALLAIAALSSSLSLLTTSLVEGNLSSLNASSYVSVLPQRVLLIAVILLADVLIARRWLVVDRGRGRDSFLDLDTDPTTDRRSRAWIRLRSVVRPRFVRQFTLRMLMHLAWQSWRQSWRWILGMPAVGLFLCFILFVVTFGLRLHLLRPEDQLAVGPFLIALITSGLYACGVFMSDQHGRSYRFLAEHAAWPRCVWLSRQVVWLLPMALLLAVSAVFFWMMTIETQRELQRMFVNMWKSGRWRGELYIFDLWRENGIFLGSFHFALWGLALGLALGQACSMFFRRALVAGFAVGVAAIPGVLLAVLLWVWELSPTSFLLPVVAGLFAATGLRAPDWLTERNTVGAWSKVLIALALPLLYAAWLLPASRQLPAYADETMLWQIENSLGAPWSGRWKKRTGAPDLQPIVSAWVASSPNRSNAAEQATANRLQHLAQSVTGTNYRTALYNSQSKESAAELAERAAAVRMSVEANREIIDEAARLARGKYEFPYLWNADPREIDLFHRRLWELVRLLQDAGNVATHNNQFDRGLDYHLAALMIEKRLLDGRRDMEPSQMQDLVQWAAADGQTSARVKQAIAALDELYPEVSDANAGEEFTLDGVKSMIGWSPPSFLMTNYLAIRDIILGKEPSRLINQYATWREFAILHLNELPFERARALAILNDVLADQTAQWYRVVRLTNQERLQRQARITQAPRDDRAFDDTARELRRLILLDRESRLFSEPPQYNTPLLSWMRTSLLLQREYEKTYGLFSWLQTFVDSRIRAWGVRQQLALIAYRLDHGQYPQSLDALVPDYLPFVPIDPYAGRPFEYRPQGLELELQGTAPHTPFLWSVGAANFRLIKRSIIEPLTESSDPGDELIDVRREAYELEPSEQYIYSSAPEIFWLPK